MSMLPGGAEKPSTPHRGVVVAGADPAPAGAMSTPTSDDAKKSAVTARRGDGGDRRGGERADWSMETASLVDRAWSRPRPWGPGSRMAEWRPCPFLPFLAVALVVVLTPVWTWRSSRRTRSCAALGLAAVFPSSQALFNAIKVVGAAYLVYLGIQALMASRRSGPNPAPEPWPSRVLSRRPPFARDSWATC